MEMLLQRDDANKLRTHGKLYIEDEFLCYTLEDQVREVKIPMDTAIPAGRYKVLLTKSARFGRILPILVAVPKFAGVRIHSGNTTADTAGCILVGMIREKNTILKSKDALTKLLVRIGRAIDANQPVYLTVANVKEQPAIQQST